MQAGLEFEVGKTIADIARYSIPPIPYLHTKLRMEKWTQTFMKEDSGQENHNNEALPRFRYAQGLARRHGAGKESFDNFLVNLNRILVLADKYLSVDVCRAITILRFVLLLFVGGESGSLPHRPAPRHRR
jgi:hypothetical protein